MPIPIHVVLDINAPALTQVLREATVAFAHITGKIDAMSATVNNLDASISQLLADNLALKAAVDAAPQEIATLVAAGIASAAQQGVSATQLQQLADLHTSLGGEVAQLQAALAGTAPTVTPPDAPPATPDAPPVA